jgi:hypothetical protein
LAFINIYQHLSSSNIVGISKILPSEVIASLLPKGNSCSVQQSVNDRGRFEADPARAATRQKLLRSSGNFLKRQMLKSKTDQKVKAKSFALSHVLPNNVPQIEEVSSNTSTL